MDGSPIGKECQQAKGQEPPAENEKLDFQKSRVVCIQLIFYKWEDVNAAFRQEDINPHHNTADGKRPAHVIGVAVIYAEKSKMEQPKQQERRAPKGGICFDSHLIVRQRQNSSKERESNGEKQLNDFRSQDEEEPGCYGVPLADRQGKGIGNVVKFPSVKAGEEDAQGGIKEDGIIWIIWNQHHGGKQLLHGLPPVPDES